MTIRPPWQAAVILALGAACLVFATFALGPRASAAERTIAGPHELNSYRAGRDYRVDRPNVERIGGPYASREACRHAAMFVRVESGLKLRCDAVDEWRVQ